MRYGNAHLPAYTGNMEGMRMLLRKSEKQLFPDQGRYKQSQAIGGRSSGGWMPFSKLAR
ncbi:hypothetical protein GCM10011403_01050 [Pseudohongiella nitratireducens]|uniref:Uncharacterized protein n=1 Tax=Pseudohongiella nitratireducens TaxID=1768907 RepID=A0A917GJA5_9GAMM|nr:hypothetical protein GCM10011403_01050 [Pseudohongiella nitratireducens]